jgi:single stranded DNA-binding protein
VLGPSPLRQGGIADQLQAVRERFHLGWEQVPAGVERDAGGRIPELRHTEGGIARATLRVAVSGRREQEPSFFTVVVWRDQAEHAAESLSRGSRVVVVGRLQQRTWTSEDGSARQAVEIVAEELDPSLRWATATPMRASRSASE